MNLCFRFLFPFVLAITLTSCSNEIDVLADYEENASVYALLDPNYSTQFVKINKVFVNPNSKASDVAKIADSLYFDSINPELVELETGKRIPLFRANILLKDSGFFANSPNYLYVTNERIWPDKKYRFEMELPSSGKQVFAETNISYLPIMNNPINVFTRIMSISPTGSVSVDFTAPKNGKIFDAYFHFNYIEIDKLDTNIKVNKSFSWNVLRTIRTNSDKGGERIIQKIPGAIFYDLLLAKIPINNSVFRRFTTCELVMTSGNTVLDTYIQGSTPSIGIVQKQTDYSNITNGIGIFGSRNTLYLNDVTVSDLTKSYIINDTTYKKLGFVK